LAIVDSVDVDFNVDVVAFNNFLIN